MMHGHKVMEMGFFYASCLPGRMSLQRKKPKAKIAQCSGMSKFCPPAAALRKSMRGNRHEWTRCAANGGWGGEVLNKIGRGAHLSRHPLPKLGFSFSGFFLKAQEARSKKKQGGRQQDRNSCFG
jgi:hypothetical protein